MARYINEDEFVAWVKEHWCADCQNDNGLRCRACWIDDAIDIVEEAPEADVVPKSEVAELLRLMFNDDCACNYNGNDEWLPFKCKYALTDCPMPQERLGCWMEFVEYGLAELKKKYQGGEPNG